jgi:hypothetical protein
LPARRRRRSFVNRVHSFYLGEEQGGSHFGRFLHRARVPSFPCAGNGFRRGSSGRGGLR